MNESKAMSGVSLNAKKVTMLALLAAVAYVVMYLSKLIPVNILGFLNFDLKDVIVCITGFLFGPLSALAISVVVSVIEMVTVSSTGPWGLLMNVLSTCAFACTAAVFYQRRRTMKSAVLGLVAGALLMTAVMLLWNYLITPIYMGMPRAAVAGLLVPYFLPFNLLKAGINGTLTVLLYKPIVNALRKARLVDSRTENTPADDNGRKLGAAIVTLALLATFVLLALVLAGVL